MTAFKSTPKIGVGVIVRNEHGHVLFQKRRGAHGSETWGFPGGKLESGETLIECAARELEEETGMTAGTYREIGYTNDIFADEGLHYITFYVEATDIKGAPMVMEPEKCICWEWFAIDNLPQPLFLPIINFLQKDESLGLLRAA